MKRILIIEDDPVVLTGLQMSLQAEGYETACESDGEAGYRRALDEQFDALILDLSLPSKNGLYICRDLRQQNIETPILMLTSRSEEMDKVLGFDYGADDYLTKPFSLIELLARVKALLRRSTMSGTEPEVEPVHPEEHADEIFSFGDMTVYYKRQEVEKDGSILELSTKEFQILRYFISHPREVITRDMLLDNVWGYEQFPTTRTVDNYILSLRKKIEHDPSTPVHILTVHNAGYKFVP